MWNLRPILLFYFFNRGSTLNSNQALISASLPFHTLCLRMVVSSCCSGLHTVGRPAGVEMHEPESERRAEVAHRCLHLLLNQTHE